MDAPFNFGIDKKIIIIKTGTEMRFVCVTLFI